MIQYVNCNAADALVAGQVFRLTFIQTTLQKVGAFLFYNLDWAAETMAVYEKSANETLMPYAYPVSEPPVQGSDAAVVDLKIRIQEFHSGAVSDLVNAAGELSPYVDVSRVERVTAATGGQATRASAISQTTKEGQQEAQDTGFLAGITKSLRSFGTILTVLAVGAGLVAVAYVISKVPNITRK